MIIYFMYDPNILQCCKEKNYFKFLRSYQTNHALMQHQHFFESPSGAALMLLCSMGVCEGIDPSRWVASLLEDS